MGGASFEVGKPLCQRALGAKEEVAGLLAGSDLELLGLDGAGWPAGGMGPQGLCQGVGTVVVAPLRTALARGGGCEGVPPRGTPKWRGWWGEALTVVA